MTTRKVLASFSLALFLVAPVSAFAAPPQLSNLVTTSAPTVTRANFLNWSFVALSLPKPDTCELPYQRVPRAQKPMLCAAQERGALKIFGNSKISPFNKNITRGEAIEVLTALTGLHEQADVSAFKDLKTDSQKKAAANAVSHKWMVPLRANLFGVAQPLSGIEALSLLQAASGQSPIQQKITITVTPGISSAGELPQQQLLETVWQLIQRDYLKSDKLDKNEVGYKTIDAMVKSLGDPYSSFFRPLGATDFQDQFKGEVSGIGAHIEDKAGVMTIVAPLAGSPAEKAGLQAGDEIISADGKKLEGLSLEQAVQYIRGPKGTTVELVIRRNDEDMTVRITRDVVSIPEIRTSWNNGVAIVELLQFGETTQKQIRSVFADIQKEKPKGIILDLRNNPGGLLSAADIVASNFLPNGSVVAQVKTPHETTLEKTEGEPTVDPGVKVMVLVNKGSASASEIVAGALQDHKRATVIGAVTFGKGSVQEILTFKTGELLKLTVANYFTPDGHIVDGIGITPDIMVEGEPGTQLTRAMGLLR